MTYSMHRVVVLVGIVAPFPVQSLSEALLVGDLRDCQPAAALGPVFHGSADTATKPADDDVRGVARVAQGGRVEGGRIQAASAAFLRPVGSTALRKCSRAACRGLLRCSSTSSRIEFARCGRIASNSPIETLAGRDSWSIPSRSSDAQTAWPENVSNARTTSSSSSNQSRSGPGKRRPRRPSHPIQSAARGS